MTPEEFRSDAKLRGQLDAIVKHPAFRLGCEAVLHQFIAMDATTGAPEVASVRLLTQRVSFELAFRELAKLPMLPEPEPVPQPDDWGDPKAAALLAEDLPEPYAGPTNPS